jgi:hypothetical protein
LEVEWGRGKGRDLIGVCVCVWGGGWRWNGEEGRGGL